MESRGQKFPLEAPEVSGPTKQEILIQNPGVCQVPTSDHFKKFSFTVKQRKHNPRESHLRCEQRVRDVFIQELVRERLRYIHIICKYSFGTLRSGKEHHGRESYVYFADSFIWICVCVYDSSQDFGDLCNRITALVKLSLTPILRKSSCALFGHYLQ